MRYVFKNASSTYDLDISHNNDEIIVKWEGKEQKSSISRIGDGVGFVINNDGKILTGWAVRQKNRIYVSVLGNVIVLEDISRGDDTASSAGGGGSVDNVVSPMPGAVIKVLISSGQSVKKNQTLVIVEAMKMENEVRAPNDATISKVLVEPGKQVGAGEVLVTFEQNSEE